jgi:hypothetical protein
MLVSVGFHIVGLPSACRNSGERVEAVRWRQLHAPNGNVKFYTYDYGDSARPTVTVNIRGNSYRLKDKLNAGGCVG